MTVSQRGKQLPLKEYPEKTDPDSREPELTVALPCGCKMHYDCILHALRGYEAYIYAEEHRYFDCPRCRCEYNQEEQWYMDRRLSLYMPAEYECRIWEITRHNFKPPEGDKYSEVGLGWWAESSRPPEIFM